MWTEKYRPKTFDQVVGNLKAKKEIMEWIDNWKENNPQKCLLLVGPPGTGKTTLAHVIASKFSDHVELNASDKRSYDIIMRTIGEASATTSLFNKGLKLIILDEVDGLHGRDDRGGVRAINKIIKEGKHPIIMMANDPYSNRIKGFKTKCNVVTIRKVHTNSIAALLKKICVQEGIEFDDAVLKDLAKRSSGDLRSAINDLEIMAQGEEKITSNDLDLVSQKDNVSNIFDSVRTVLKSKTLKRIKEAMRLQEDPNFVLELITENIPREYEKNYEIEKAYDMVSLADLNFGRAFNTRDYTYWRYTFDFMGLGVALAKDETYKKFARYGTSSVYTLLSKSRAKRDLRNKVAEKIGEKLHVSKKEAITQFPYFETMFQNDETAYELANYFDLDDSEVKLFRSKKIKVKKSKKKKSTTNKSGQKGVSGSGLYSTTNSKKSSKSQKEPKKSKTTKNKNNIKKGNNTGGKFSQSNSKKDSKPDKKVEQTSLFSFK
ncbi:MAG: replication factor C large subunit [Methanobacteriaceae archaeon]|jgi:replication factor C large subunit|nr:MAG: AAA family ATPase [Methanobacterium sp. BRmetb2]MCC7557232.1 replication factor C large subunit [Methanobacteriaceae archaeon]